jgi:molecular chaperone DnaK
LDVNGLLSVSAREEKSGKEQSIKIEGASILARDEVSQMIKEAEENSALDKARKSLVNINYEFDNFLLKSEFFLSLEKENSQILEKQAVFRSFLNLLKKMKKLYVSHSLTQLSDLLSEDLDFLMNPLLFANMKTKIRNITNSQKRSSSSKGKKGNIIDIDNFEEE